LTKDEVKLLEDNANPQYVYFDKKQSLYAQIVADLLQQRIDVKNAMENNKKDPKGMNKLL
jgi:hypothetical protein